MVTVGLLIRVEAHRDRIAEVEEMLESAIDHIRAEGLAVAWFALRPSPTSFAIMDVFRTEADREAHLAANIDTIRDPSGALFVSEPTIERLDVVSALLPDA